MNKNIKGVQPSVVRALAVEADEKSLAEKLGYWEGSIGWALKLIVRSDANKPSDVEIRATREHRKALRWLYKEYSAYSYLDGVVDEVGDEYMDLSDMLHKAQENFISGLIPTVWRHLEEEAIEAVRKSK